MVQRQHPVTLAIGAAMVLVALVFRQPVSAQEAAPKPAVTTVRAELQTVAETEVFRGRVEAINRVDLRARVNGFVESVGFEEGRRVAQGAVLFEIEPDAYEAALTRIDGQIKSAESEKTLADIEVDRQRTLVQRQAVAEVALDEATASQGKLEGALLELQGARREAELNLSYAKILAPFDGRIGLSQVDVGDFVGPDSGALASLSSIDPIYVTFPVEEAAILDFRAEQREQADTDMIQVTLVMANGATYPETGRIVVVDTEVQRGTDTVLVRATFANPSGLLLDGQLVNVTLSRSAGEPSLTIPVQALQRDQAGYFTMVVSDDSIVEKRPIQLARVADKLAIVASGLEEGEQVVIEGAQRLRPGVEVDAQVIANDAAN